MNEDEETMMVFARRSALSGISAAVAAGTIILTATACASTQSAQASRSAAPTSHSSSPAASPTVKPGSIPIALISTDGPSGGGPYAATSLSALNAAIAASSGGAAPCGPTPCWSGATVPAHELLVAVQAASTSCYNVTALGASLPSPGTLRIDITTTYQCTGVGGGGQVPIQPDVLLAIPLSALPPGGQLRVEITGTFGQAKSTSVELPDH